MTNHKALLAALAATTCIIALASPAHAAEARDYSIEAGSLENVLEAFGRQSGEQVLFRLDDVRGKTSSGVTGKLSAEAALGKILSGTGLRIVKGAGGALAIAGNGQSGGQAAVEVAQSQGLTGAIVDPNTGAALKGAFVALAETGQSTSTDELGRYRFPGTEGVKRVRISYLGYPAVERDVEFVGGRPMTTIVLAYATSGMEIVVIAGQASARAQALNQERTADNSVTVISSDLLGNFQGTTVSEALRKAPGVAFQQDGAQGYRTGDGTNIIVRGLAPDYNQVTLNGVVLPNGTGVGRASDLGSILADSVSEVRISKTLLPSQDGAGTGGLVDIKTKSPLDRPRRFVSFGVERAKRAKDFGDDLLLTGAFSARFGSEGNLGASLSVQYRDRKVKNFSYQASLLTGPYLPLRSGGVPAGFGEIDPRTPYPFEDSNNLYPNYAGATYNEAQSKTIGLNAAIEWQVNSSTNLKLDYVRQDQDVASFRSYLNLVSQAWYSLMSVPSLGGQSRYVLNDPLILSANTGADYSEGEKQSTDTVSFRGETTSGRLRLNYRAGWASGRTSTPAYNRLRLLVPPLDFSGEGLLLPSATDPQTGAITTIFGVRSGRAFPLPLFSQAGFDLLNQPASTRFESVGVAKDQRGKNSTISSGFDAQYEMGGNLNYLKAGVDFSQSRFSNRLNDEYYYSGVRDQNYNFPVASSLGIEFEDIEFGRFSDTSGYVKLPTLASVRSLMKSLDQTVKDGRTTYAEALLNPLNGNTYTKERNFSSYFEGKIALGDVEIIGGGRVTQVKVDAAIPSVATLIDETGQIDFELQTRTRKIVQGSAKQTDLLPRILINFRPEENLVFRAGYYSTVARPQVSLLSSEQNAVLSLMRFYGPTGNRPLLEINRGNPGLRPAVTQNFDVGAEIYDSNVGAIKANVFYKRITNLLETTSTQLTDLNGVELPDDPRFTTNLPSDIFIVSRRPVNNPDVATIWGVELSMERRLEFLPGMLSGIGIYANYTFTKSRKNEPRSWYKPLYNSAGGIDSFVQEEYLLEDVPFDQSSPHSGTASLTYNKFGIDASLSYSYQARRKINSSDYYLWQYEEALSTLDFRAEYRFKARGGDFGIYVEGSDLLKGSRDADTQYSVGGVNGVPKSFTQGYFRGGRNFTLGLRASF